MTTISTEQALKLCRDELHWIADNTNQSAFRYTAIKLLERTAPDKVAPAVPDGWQLVPKEPTPEMFHAANKLLKDQCADVGLTENSLLDARKAAGNYYRVMLAAAPTGAGK